MPAKIKQGKYVDSDGVQQDVVFIGAEKAIFDDNGTRLDNKLTNMSKASGLTAEDAEGILGTPDANVNFQALVDAIADKVMNELVTNSALTTQLANYATKAMMSNIQVNDNNYVPTSGLVYGMNQSIADLSSDIQPTSGTLSVNDKGSGTITYTKVANIVFLMLSNVSVTQKESPYTYIADLTHPPSGTLYQDCIDSQGVIFRITLNSNGLGIQYTGDSPPYFYGIIAYTL